MVAFFGKTSPPGTPRGHRHGNPSDSQPPGGLAFSISGGVDLDVRKNVRGQRSLRPLPTPKPLIVSRFRTRRCWISLPPAHEVVYLLSGLGALYRPNPDAARPVTRYCSEYAHRQSGTRKKGQPSPRWQEVSHLHLHNQGQKPPLLEAEAAGPSLYLSHRRPRPAIAIASCPPSKILLTPAPAFPELLQSGTKSNPERYGAYLCAMGK